MHVPVRTPRLPLAIAAVLASTSLLIACTDAGQPSGEAGGASAAVAVTLQEWAVTPDPDSVPAGEVTFTITNEGPEDAHEFVVIATDLDPADLPTDETGAVDEEGEGIEVIDEVEEIAVDATEELTVTLDPGSYVLVCNVYTADENEAHYAMGMHVAFTVTD